MDKYLALINNIKAEIAELKETAVELVEEDNRISEICDTALMDIHKKKNDLDDAEIHRKNKLDIKINISIIIYFIVTGVSWFLLGEFFENIGASAYVSSFVSLILIAPFSTYIYSKWRENILRDHKTYLNAFKVNREKLEQEEKKFEKIRAKSLTSYEEVMQQIRYKERMLEEIENFNYDREEIVVNGKPFTRKLVREED